MSSTILASVTGNRSSSTTLPAWLLNTHGSACISNRAIAEATSSFCTADRNGREIHDYAVWTFFA